MRFVIDQFMYVSFKIQNSPFLKGEYLGFQFRYLLAWDLVVFKAYTTVSG